MFYSLIYGKMHIIGKSYNYYNKLYSILTQQFKKSAKILGGSGKKMCTDNQIFKLFVKSCN